MNKDKETKLDEVKSFLTKRNIFFQEFANGQLKADKINLWVTTEKWYDELTKEKGKGINSFCNQLISKERKQC